MSSNKGALSMGFEAKPEAKAKACLLLREGELTYAQIAKKVGVNIKTVARWSSQMRKPAPPAKKKKTGRPRGGYRARVGPSIYTPALAAPVESPPTKKKAAHSTGTNVLRLAADIIDQLEDLNYETRVRVFQIVADQLAPIDRGRNGAPLSQAEPVAAPLIGSTAPPPV